MINQFAKINPIVTNDGYLLSKDTDGNFTIKTIVKLKENEIGICLDDKSLIMNYNNTIIKITGGLFNTLTDARAYAALNTNNSHTGEIIYVKEQPTVIYKLIGTKLYNITEYCKKTLKIDLDGNDPSSVLNNSTMQIPVQYINGKFIINSINIKLGENYSFKVVSNTGETENPTSNIDEYEYAVLQLKGSSSGVENIFITESFKNNITTMNIEKEFTGTLSLKLYAWINSSNGYSLGDQITEYDGNNIRITIEYTPIS